MGERRTLGIGPVCVPLAGIAGLASGVAFLAVACARVDPRTLPALGLIAAALLVGALLAAGVARIGSLHVVGFVAAAIAGWLVVQRVDAGTIAVIAAFFGAGVTLLFASRLSAGSPAGRRANRAIGAVLFVAVVVLAAYIGAETPSAHWFGGGITRGPTNRPTVALTFDDGPNVTATLPIMRILDAAHIKGTFFEVGKAIDAEPQITRALYEHGQLLGNHSYHHDQWRWLDPWYPELQRTQQAFERAIAHCPGFYRPPHGDRTPFIAHIVHEHHMHMVLWDDSAHDWDETDPHTIARRIVDRAKPGSIIVLHDGLDGDVTTNRTVLVQALPRIIAGLRSRGFDIVGLDQLIGGPAYVSCR